MKKLFKSSFHFLFFSFLIVLGFTFNIEKLYAYTTNGSEVLGTYFISSAGEITFEDLISVDTSGRLAGFTGVAFGAYSPSGQTIAEDLSWGTHGSANTMENSLGCTILSSTSGECGVPTSATADIAGLLWNATDINGDGVYTLILKDNKITGGAVIYYEFTYTGGVYSSAPVVVPDGIETVTSPTATTYLNNPITFSGTYSNGAGFNQIQFDIRNTSQGIQLNTAPLNLPLVNGAGLSFSTTRNLPFQGSYTVQMRLWDTLNSSSTPWSTIVSFGLGTTSIATSTEAQNSFTPLNCGALDIGCYLKNAFAWAFYPDDATTDQFSNLSDSLQQKSPFIYMYQVGELRQELFNASTTPQQVSISTKFVPGQGSTTIVFISQDKLNSIPLSSQIKTILGFVLWFMLIEYIYYRVLRTHDSNTPS